MMSRDILNRAELNKKQYIEFYSIENLRDGYGELRKSNIILKNLFQLHKVKNLKNRKILDVGFGTGVTLLSLAKHGIPSFGVEFVEPACERLKNINTNVGVTIYTTVADIGILPFKDETFDVIICSHVLEHIENDVVAASEIQRVLKNDGLIILAVPNETYWNTNILHFRSYDQRSIGLLFSKMKLLNKINYRSIWDNIILRLGKNIFTDIIARFLVKLTFMDEIIGRVNPGKESLYILTKSTW